MAAKSITTIRQVLSYQPHQAAWFAATQALFNAVAAFYFEVIQAHKGVLALPNQEALTALEKLTHATEKNPAPVMPLSTIVGDAPALFRRAAINVALGSARSFASSLSRWRTRREKAQAKARGKRKAKPFRERPPVPPRCWNKSVTFYAGQWKERTDASILLKVWTGTCWNWLKVRITGRAIPAGVEVGSPSLIRHGNEWWLHTCVEKKFKSPATIEEQVTTNVETRICAVDLNLNEQLAVCTVQTVEGTILATRFIGGGKAIAGFRKHLFGRIARNRSKTGIIAQGEQDNAALWRKIRQADEHLAHLVSARIVQFAKEQGASILVFEHLGNLKPEKGKYSHRGNSKRAFWMKGRIFNDTKYKAWNQGIITSRVNPRNTSRECARCQSLVVRYAQGQPVAGYAPGAPLMLCEACAMCGNADRNASLVIGQRLIARSQAPLKEKPQAPVRCAGREEKSSGVALSQDAKRKSRPSTDLARLGAGNGHGTAQEGTLGMDERPSSILHPLRLPFE
jgi:IS605 OrfB family transposase